MPEAVVSMGADEQRLLESCEYSCTGSLRSAWLRVSDVIQKEQPKVLSRWGSRY